MKSNPVFQCLWNRSGILSKRKEEPKKLENLNYSLKIRYIASIVGSQISCSIKNVSIFNLKLSFSLNEKPPFLYDAVHIHTNGPIDIYSEKKMIFNFKGNVHYFFISPKGSP